MVDINTYKDCPLIVEARDKIKLLIFTKKGKYSKRKFNENYRQIQFIIFGAMIEFSKQYTEVEQSICEKYLSKIEDFVDYRNIALGDSNKFEIEMEATRNQWDDKNYY